MQRPELQRFATPLTLLLLGGVCFVFFFYGLTDIGLTGPDEPRYAAVAREMYQTGDYVTPRLHGVPWFEKPVLMYWGAALGFTLFGVGEFGARFPSALGATGVVFALYFVSRRLWGAAPATWGALILTSSAGSFAFARAASMDMPLTASLTLALFAFLIGRGAPETTRRNWFRAFYALLGLGVLAKGPVALLLPALALGGYATLHGEKGEWRNWHLKDAWIALAVPAPWYLAVTWANGFEFVRVFLIDQNLERFTSTVHGHPRPFYFYIPVLMLLSFPWTFLFLPALRRRLDAPERILLWWLLAPVVFFSFSGSKLPGYILPSLPPLAMLLSREIAGASSRTFKIATFIEAGLMLFIGVAFGFFGNMLEVDPHVDGLVITAVTVALGLCLAAIALWLRPVALAAFNFGVMTLALLAAVNFVLPRFEMTETARPWAATLERLIPSAQTVVLYRPTRWMEYGLQFYRFNKVEDVYSTAELTALLDRDAMLLLLTDDKEIPALAEIPEVEVQVVQTKENQSALWMWREGGSGGEKK
jgi:4-amino-4-deoxy-L-arabinose transferase-like glycosyltransferase